MRSSVILVCAMLIMAGVSCAQDNSLDTVDTVATVDAAAFMDQCDECDYAMVSTYFAVIGFEYELCECNPCAAADNFLCAAIAALMVDMEAAAKNFDRTARNWVRCGKKDAAIQAYLSSARCYMELYDIIHAVQQVDKANNLHVETNGI